MRLMDIVEGISSV